MKKKFLILAIFMLSFQTVLTAANYMDMGKNAYIDKNYSKAKEMFLKDIEQYDRGDSYYFLGEIEKLQKNYSQAAEYFKIAITKPMTKKYMVNAYWNLIVLSEERNDYEQLVLTCKDMWWRTHDNSAKTKVEKLINKLLWTNNENAIEKYNEGAELLKNKKKDQAMNNFMEASLMDPSFLAPKFELGINAYNNGNETEALNYLSEIAYKIPFYAEIQLILGDINYKNENYTSAIENFSSVILYGFISSSLQYDTILKRGNCYYNTSEFDKAETDIEEAQKYKKNNLNLLLLLSAIQIKKKNYDGALKTLASAEKISHENPVILFRMGSIYYHKKNEDYVAYFDRLFNITDNEKSDQINLYAEAFKILMISHFEKKNYPRTIEVAETLIKNNNDYESMLIVARSYFYLNNFHKSIDYFENLSLAKDDLFLLSIAYIRNDMKEKSKDILKYLINDPESKQNAETNQYTKPLISELLNEQSHNNNNEINQTSLEQ